MQVSPQLQQPRPAPGPLADDPSLLFAEQHVLFAGAPQQCVGYIVLRNPTKCRVRTRCLYLQYDAPHLFDSVTCGPESGPIIELENTEGCGDNPSPKSPSEGGTGTETEEPVLFAAGGETHSSSVPALPLRVIPLRVKLGPCETQEVRVQVPISPTAPPGDYRATLFDPQGASCRATIQVHERRATRVHPSVVRCSATPGDKRTWEVELKNVGNVVSELLPGAVVHLSSGDENWHRHFHRAVARLGEQGHEQVLDHFVKSLGGSEHMPIKGKLVLGAGSLAPGEGRRVTLELTVPPKLPTRRYFNAVTRLADGVFTAALYITPSDTDHSNESSEPEPNP